VCGGESVGGVGWEEADESGELISLAELKLSALVPARRIVAPPLPQ